MDLGCLDLGCLTVQDKQGKDEVLDSTSSTNNRGSGGTESVIASFKFSKNKSPREAGQSTSSPLNKFTSQIKKPPHRKASPLNWYPRKKVESYLKRKIRLLQEVGGMNSTLDETLNDANPHYCRVEREKIAARQAARKAMEARKAAMVEASWCKILRAARIQCKEAEALLLKAEKSVAEAFEAATAVGVIMYDKADDPRKLCEVESSSVTKGGSTMHTIKASLETAFEVDKEVAAAVKSAFIKLANCPTVKKEEFKDLLRKISENPDTDGNSSDVSELSECESDNGSEFDPQNDDGFVDEDSTSRMLSTESGQRKFRKKQLSDKFNTAKLVDMMLERLKCLQEDELASLATIVATCGLNAALAEVENHKEHNFQFASDYTFNMAYSSSRRMSSMGIGNVKSSDLDSSNDGHMRKQQVESELPSLDKFLVKRMSKLEREVQEAKNTRKNMSEEMVDYVKKSDHRERDVEEVPSLDTFLVKHVSRLEREIEEARNRRKNEKQSEKENINLNNKALDNNDTVSAEVVETFSVPDGKMGVNELETSLDRILVKPMHKIEMEKMQALSLGIGEIQRQQKKQGGSNTGTCEGLDKVLVKHVSRLEREKIALGSKEDEIRVNRRNVNTRIEAGEEGGLDQVLVKHKSKLEREKMAAAAQELDEKPRTSVSQRREARERELQEAWRGLSLGKTSEEAGGLHQVLVKHKSRLEREKMAAVQQQDEPPRNSVSQRREARDRELQEAWGGLGLGNSIKPHLSRLERERASCLDESRGGGKKASSKGG
ncbi:hypothetical protein RJ641_019217 [Dillenia turbinata]|uniref:Uncharacterized protein n=1 Tax=Dillenia turbinata TaxID=194707 RepID=A0AAN8UQZ8_9MAGN